MQVPCPEQFGRATGLVLSSQAPLYGRAREIIDVHPIEVQYLRQVFPGATETALVEHYAAWGGIPWYWELASEAPGTPRQRIDRLVLDPLAPLHMEPDRLLLEETPSALEVRPVLDAIGAGAHRVSEIGARLGRPATSLSRPIGRLVEMGLVRREIPFGEPARKSKKSLYRIDDPFFRLWFRVVAANRGVLASAPSRSRLALLDKYHSHLVGAAWEDLCRTRLPSLRASTRAGRRGPWTAPSRWWSGSAPEWDIVSESADGHTILLGEAKWTHQPLELSAVARARHELEQRAPPELGATFSGRKFVRVLFVPAVRGVVPAGDVLVVTARELF
jgi:AAA+ ATPase superfamily predicted ATPase